MPMLLARPFGHLWPQQPGLTSIQQEAAGWFINGEMAQQLDDATVFS
jgi:hypothetical protein